MLYFCSEEGWTLVVVCGWLWEGFGSRSRALTLLMNKKGLQQAWALLSCPDSAGTLCPTGLPEPGCWQMWQPCASSCLLPG